MTKFEKELDKEIQLLQREGQRHGRWVSATTDWTINGVHQKVLCLAGYRLPKGWSEPETDLFIVLPYGYPGCCPPHSFWTKPLKIEDGGWPHNSDYRMSHRGYHLRLRFPLDTARMQWWMLYLQAWNPNHDTLLNYERCIQRRLSFVE